MRPVIAALLLSATGLTLTGCRAHPPPVSPTAAGLNVRDLVDPAAQAEAEDLNPPDQLAILGERLRVERKAGSADRPPRHVLCLSGGGAFGAFSAGVLVGWTGRGDRPTFDVVTGVSTGALIAPFAFLGPEYDPTITDLYTTIRTRDLYRLRLLTALLGESFADNRRMAARVDAAISPAVTAAIAAAHRAGRRLYVGTTEQEGKQFVVWDVGAIAAGDAAGGRELIVQILLGSAAPPGFFPAAEIGVTVDGVRRVERHTDGGVSQSIFFRPPYVPPEARSDPAARDLAGTRVYAVVAGKLYADPEAIRPRAISQASKNVAATVYAQTRRNLQQVYADCVVAGMDYHLAAIPPGYPAPRSSLEFRPAVMVPLFEEGRRVGGSAAAWRTLPPGAGPGEGPLARAGTALTHRPRGPAQPVLGPDRLIRPPASDRGGIPAVPREAAVK
ncbi:patatin-like phospholipase family protein [Limnoglobus roseus]|uniref:Patatin n=1 Tax=Limnoglobus roseus TaxID=2598579 RepID=A0A5C1AJX6_9BACT|nr:patatin-like phospholipase family protein [Limnoglobus roseus]QEL19511.1 patatin [Limnoglobus roseus]